MFRVTGSRSIADAISNVIISTEAADPTPVRIGVIGAGWFASRRHLPDMQANPHAALVSLCRRDPEARTRLAERFDLPSERCYAHWQQMLDEVEMDAVLIATPNALHYEPARAALERGLHVMVEKPMTVRSADAHALVALAKSKGLQLTVCLNPPFWAHCHLARRALQSEAMGPLESISMYWTGSAEYVFGRAPKPDDLPGIVPPTMYRSDPELNGGGYFIDGGPHLISELLWLTGLRARRVTALMDETPMDMRVALSIELEDGVIATVNSLGDSKFGPGKRRVSNLFGASNGTVTIETFEFDTTIEILGRETQRFKEADLHPVSNPITNFVEAIRGENDLFSTPEHGAHVVDVIEAAYASAVSGRTIPIGD